MISMFRDSAGASSAAVRLPAPLPRHAALAAGDVRRAVAVAVLPVTAVLLSLTSAHVKLPVVTGLYYGYLTLAPLVIGLYWWARRPRSRFGPLLVAFGFSAWMVSWQSADWAPLFDVGVLADAPFLLLTFWLFLGFPSGRLGSRVNRLLIGGLAIALGCFFLPWVLLSPVIAGGGPLAACVPGCPANALQVGSVGAGTLELLGRWEIYVGLATTLAVLVVYALRLRTASRPRRRALVAVTSTSLLFMPAFFAFHFSSWILEADPSTVQALGWGLLATRILLPVGFLVALLQADLFAGAARSRLLEQLLSRPGADRWEHAVSEALDDPALRLGYWDAEAGRYRDAAGEEVDRPPAGSGRAWACADRDG